MEEVERLIKNLENLNKGQNLINLTLKAIKKNEKEIIELVTKGQIYGDGVNVKGSKLKRKGAPYSIYSKGYTRLKKRLGKYQGHIDLSLSGNYLRGFKIEYVSDGIFVKNDNHTVKGFNLSEHLRESYGEYEGFTDKNTERVFKIIEDDLVKLIAEAMFEGVAA